MLINHAMTEIYHLLSKDVRQFPDSQESREMKERLKMIGDRVYSWIRITYPEIDPEVALQ